MAEKKYAPEPENNSLAMDNCFQQAKVTRRHDSKQVDALDCIAEEIPVALVYNGISHVVMMASPADLEDFALGFSLSEGIVHNADEIYDIESIPSAPDNLNAGIEVQISITTQRAIQLKQQRRNLTGRTGCGICGAESLLQAIRPVNVVNPHPTPNTAAVENAIQQLTAKQPLQNITGACHGAAWCDGAGNIQLLREDVGRHNALDKLLGILAAENTTTTDGFVLISSRASYEMVQKATSCGVSTLVAVSAPTKMALDLARQANLNLIGFARPGRHVIYNQALLAPAITSKD